MTYRRDIDGLRALAVLAVVLSHAGVPGFAGGYVGVDLFFVISGYLICGILARELAAGEFSLLGFYERRVRRILPPLLLVIAACFVLGWLFLPPPAYEGLARSAIPAVTFWSNYHFRDMGQEYFVTSSELEPLLHTWSLAAEEQFYLGVPIAMWLAWKIDKRLLLPGALLATAVSLYWSTRLVDTSPTGAFYTTQSRAWELGVGAVLALLPRGWILPRWLAEALALAGLAAIAYAVLAYDGGTPFPGLAALPPVLGAAALVAAGQGGATLVTRLLSLPPMVWLGLVSYALYLWHWPALVLARQLHGEIDLPWLPTVLALASALVLAIASTVLVERPLRRRGARAVVQRRGAFAIAGLASLALVAAAALVLRNDGFWSRAPELRAVVTEATRLSPVETRCRASWRGDREPCAIGAPGGTPQVLVWGDSHAAALLPGIELVLRERGLAGAATVATGCPPIIGYQRGRHGGDIDCGALGDDVLALLDGDPDAYSTVVLGGYWLSSMATERRDRPMRRKGGWIDLATGEAVAPADTPQMIETALDRLVVRLTGSGRRVVLVADVPTMPGNPPELLLGQAFGAAEAATEIPLAEVRAQNAGGDAMLQRLARHPGVVVVDPVALMCGNACPIARDGHLLYRDTNHVSAWAARYYVPLMLEGVEF